MNDSDEIRGELLPASKSELAAEIREAIGAGPDEPVEVYAPPHKSRMDGKQAAFVTSEEFDGLRHLSKEKLIELGLRPWDDSGLLLFPHEWYDLIPDGFEIVDILGESEKFKRGDTDDDCRYGVLAFGIIPGA